MRPSTKVKTGEGKETGEGSSRTEDGSNFATKSLKENTVRVDSEEDGEENIEDNKM